MARQISVTLMLVCKVLRMILEPYIPKGLLALQLVMNNIKLLLEQLKAS
jgi:multisubunit Na+/H+ antiporter MnhF subunit